MSFTIAPIVEGYGDVPAVRVLLNRLAPMLAVAQPVRQGRGKLVQREGLKHAVNIAAANITETGAILIMFDADTECAVQRSQELTAWLRADFPHLVCRVVLAVRGFEAWIIGGDPHYGVHDPDNAGNVKGRIKERYGTYQKTVDQPRHIAKADLNRLQNNSRSFRKLRKVVAEFETMAT